MTAAAPRRLAAARPRACCSSIRSRRSRGRCRRCIGGLVAGGGSGSAGLVGRGRRWSSRSGWAFSRWFTTRYRMTETASRSSSGLFRRRLLRGLPRPDPDRRRHRARPAPAARPHPCRDRHRPLGPGGGRQRPARRPDRGGGARAARGAAAPPGGAGRGGRSRSARGRRGAPAPAAALEPEIELARLDPTLGPLRAVHALGRRRRRRGRSASCQRHQRGATSIPANFGPCAPPRRLARGAPRSPWLILLSSRPSRSLWWRSRRRSGTCWPSGTSGSPGNPRGTLHVTRGLITTRATTIEERRLHGVELSEPLLLRAVRGARCLSPSPPACASAAVPSAAARCLCRRPARRGRARRRRRSSATRSRSTARSSATGPRARARRYTRALAGWALVVAAWRSSTGVADPWRLPVAASRCCPSALALAADRYRNLGHAVSGPRLVAGGGSLVRRRPPGAEGIIGWNVERSFFQRRAGLATLTPPRPPAASTTTCRTSRSPRRCASPRRSCRACSSRSSSDA